MPDISICPHCKSDFRSRGRLIQHLLKRRGGISTKNRRTCHDAFLSANPNPLEQTEIDRLSVRDREIARSFRKAGHQQERAIIPCKRARKKHDSPAQHGNFKFEGYAWKPKKRLRCKTSFMYGASDSERPCKRLRTKTSPDIACPNMAS